MMKRNSAILVIWLSVILGATACADVRLPGFFGDHMVLQQEMPIKVWGWAEASEKVTVELGGNSSSATADANGNWSVELPAMTASDQPHKLSVKSSKNAVELSDVLIGEVWLCSGQSNMEWTVSRSKNSKQEIEEADFPMIRHMKVAHRKSVIPIDDVPSTWDICSPKTAGNFTACGYFMARKLHQELKVPIGLVNSSWGGTRVEPWTPPVGFQKVPAVKDIYQSVMGRTPGTDVYKNRLGKHIDATEAWLSKAKNALAMNEKLKPSPAFPPELVPFTSHQEPTMLYNGMIHAIVGFPVRGAIWYQGESNHAEGMMYYEKKKALIQGWREIWGQEKLPFYFVQIAPFQYGNEDHSILARFWEAQAKVTELPDTGMVVINDIATLRDIHPPNKQDVGLRLAGLALKHQYGQSDLVAHSPVLDSVKAEGNKLVVSFANTGGGLKTRDDKSPTHFEIIGPGVDGFRDADATIDGDKVILSSDKVAAPTAFRFAWHKLAEPNLTGGTGLPVGAVRGGKVPQFMDLVPDAKDYQLVYELDLGRLNQDIKYDVDNSDSVSGEFDRIAYLLELNSEEYGAQKVFVSAKAFTNDIRKTGVPTARSKAHFQQSLEALEVFSNVNNLAGESSVRNANIEFWPNNYGPSNSAKVNGASDSKYDFGDQPSDQRKGYGSMQIHNTETKQTIFAINSWKQGNDADIGIGNSPGEHADWTFSRNGGIYSSKRLKVFVRLAN